jgi:hypothetical protein
MHTVDMVTFAFICKIERSKLSIAFYDSIQHNIKNKLVYTLTHNKTFIVHNEFVSWALVFHPHLDTVVLYLFYGVNKTNGVIIIRKIHQDLNIKERHIYSVARKIEPITYNIELWIFLMRYKTLRSHLLYLEIGCFVQNSFNLGTGSHTLSKLHIDMQQITATDVKQFLMNKVTIDNQRNILLIHQKKDEHGNSLYDGINVYSKI